MSSLFAAGLSEKEVLAELGREFPAKEIAKLRASLKQAGCCDGLGGAIIINEAEFEEKRPRRSLRERS